MKFLQELLKYSQWNQLDVDFLAVASFYVYTQESLQRFDRPFRIVRIFDVDLCDFVTIHFAGVGNVERQCDRLVFGNLARRQLRIPIGKVRVAQAVSERI